MNPISHVKLFRGGQLPDLDVPIVIVTFEQTRDEFFFAEYFILYQKSQLLDSCRASCKNAEEAKEYLKLRTPEGVIQDMRDAAQAEIEGKVVKSLSKEHQYQWILRAAYTLTPMKFEDLHTLWLRGRVEEPIRQTARITRCMELKRELDRILALPLLKFKEEKPIPAR